MMLQVICSVCDTEQPVFFMFQYFWYGIFIAGLVSFDFQLNPRTSQVAQVCTNCGVNMGEYFCDICKFYDDDVSMLSHIILMIE